MPRTPASPFETFGGFDPGDRMMSRICEYYAKLKETDPEAYEQWRKNVAMREKIKKGEF